ncbi:MAG TPA: S9 family peptidase [Bryobacteraceae bacterium]|jgi:dipeptidyl aminopeptidase/acylaminoacyl peptidase
MYIKMFATGILALLAATSLAAAATWTPEAMMKVKAVAAVQPSPDGHWAVWTERSAVMDPEKSEFVEQVFLGKSDGSWRIQLTHGEKSSSRPQWSTDGKFVYYASDRGAKNQIYRIPVDGGEAEAVSDFKGGAGSFQISPNGKWIAFTGREPDASDERARREKVDFRVIGENPKNQSLWIVAADGDKAAARKLANGPYTIGGFDWSPDSRTIAYEIRPTPDADNGRLADIMEVDLESGVAKAIATTPGTEAEPRYSPDGKYLAYVRTSSSAGTIAPARIVLMTRATGAIRELPASFDESPNLTSWTKDHLVFVEAKGTRSVIYSVPVDGPITAVEQPAQGTLSGASLNKAGTYAGFTMQSASEPPEAYVMDLASGKMVRVSAANTSVPREGLGVTKVIRWKSKDGREIEGLLTLPPDYRAGTKIPLILNIHGGPAGAFGEQFIGAGSPYPIAAFAEKGWAVLRPNPRGSSAYGRAFRAANLEDWGGGDYRDIMAGVDEVIREGIADPNRMAVMGWSYGGYMTNWVITQTNRFKCAAAGAGLTDMPSMWGTNDIPSVLDDYFTGPWYEQQERYLQQSPLYHVKNVKTPTLYLHGESDNRVPISQAFEMYHALKRLGVETQMVTYPRQPHGPQEPKFIVDIMNRHIAWVEKHINPAPAVSGN